MGAQSREAAAHKPTLSRHDDTLHISTEKREEVKSQLSVKTREASE